ncbi:uncharacterized protein LOC143299804 [Babylonia areolata]|uniref:uncharacterized protein LOC143299804 n=1 Tax=Babylonia areolata TaxID=304850 RepID=UPI003FD67CF7
MATRTMKQRLRLVIAVYIISFIVIMYLWQRNWGHQDKERQPSSLSQHEALHKVHMPAAVRSKQAAAVRSEQAAARESQEGRADLDLAPHPQSVTLNEQLLIRAEAVNVRSGGNGSSDAAAAGVGEGPGGADHTLTSRLTSVFHSVLDCPRKLPLTFLGMNWSSVDLGQDPACTWLTNSVRNAEQSFVTLGQEMAVLRDVTLNPRQFLGTRGGEKIESVFNQKEDAEYFNVKAGFFSLPCNAQPPGVSFHVDKRNYRRFNHLNQWFSTLTCNTSQAEEAEKARGEESGGTGRGWNHDAPSGIRRGHIPGVTLALERYEYANVYHTMLDWYNSFLSLLLLGLDPGTLTFLIVDGHPWGKLDSTWANLFGGRGVLRAGHLPGPTRFDYMVWVPNGYHCPLFDTDRQHVPFLPQLREYFFRSYGVAPNPGPQCRQLRMLLVRRRDYLAHPRNPKGVLARKMDNENQVRDALVAAFPQHQVTAEQLDLLPMRQQLQVLSRVDVLVGMHGAALTYTVLLPEGAALVELYPKYAGRTSLLFKQISKWRGIHYVNWMNKDSKNEKPNKFTHIPPTVVVDLVKQMISKMCGGEEGGGG